MKKREKGLYGKYRVRRTDGNDTAMDKHHNCNYFVLDLDHDKFAPAAIKAYAAACRSEYPTLANDLDRYLTAVGEYPDGPEAFFDAG